MGVRLIRGGVDTICGMGEGEWGGMQRLHCGNSSGVGGVCAIARQTIVLLLIGVGLDLCDVYCSRRDLERRLTYSYAFIILPTLYCSLTLANASTPSCIPRSLSQGPSSLVELPLAMPPPPL